MQNSNSSFSQRFTSSFKPMKMGVRGGGDSRQLGWMMPIPTLVGWNGWLVGSEAVEKRRPFQWAKVIFLRDGESSDFLHNLEHSFKSAVAETSRQPHIFEW